MAREITQHTTVGQVATSYPELIPELERLGLDYCCGGSRTLAEAASRAGRDLPGVLARLSECRPPDAPPAGLVGLAEMTITELADHIEQTHHSFARDALTRIERLIGKCVAAHGDEEPRLVELQGVFATLADDMYDHFEREERVLFPWLRRLERMTIITGGPPWSVRRPIDCMVHDHDDVGEAFARVHALTDDLTPPEGACPTWRECYRSLAELEQDTHLHIHKENNILFPAGVVAEHRLVGEAPPRRHKARRTRRAFTLIELMVVIAVVGMLVGVLLPALGGARSAGRAVVCLANSRSIATAMTIYTDDDPRGFFPTARMPSMPMGGNPAAPFQMSWIYLIAPYVGVEIDLPDDPMPEQIGLFVRAMEVCKCPDDHSRNWDAAVAPRLASYGINAYLTPNHPPHWGIRTPQIVFPSRCVLSAELTEEMGTDHFMPMFWGDPPAVSSPMMQLHQWDPAARLPRVIQHTRHGGERANYVFTDGHAGAHPFSDTWEQTPGQPPSRNWYDPVIR